MQFLTWKNGWKTYATVVLGIGFGVADSFHYTIPHLQTLEVVLGFMGIGFGRMAITNQSKMTAQALTLLVQDVLQQVTVPTTVTTVTTTTPPKSVVLDKTPEIVTTAVTTGPTPVVLADTPKDDLFFDKGGDRK